MSVHEKKGRPHRSVNKSPIATPPRTFQGRPKTSSDSITNDSTSTKPNPGANASDEDESTIAAIAAKDKKINDLQKEIVTMEDAFEAELTRLSLKLTDEGETSQSWQQKYSALNQNFLKTDTELRLLRQELGGFNQVKEERDRDIRTRISSLILDRDAFREAYNEAMGELRGKDEKLRELQGQVKGLKSWVSREGKTVGGEQMSDEVIGERMRGLGNGLQNWVITNFRKVKIERLDIRSMHLLKSVLQNIWLASRLQEFRSVMLIIIWFQGLRLGSFPSTSDKEIDVDRLNDETKDLLQRLVPTYESLVSVSKVHFIQSLVSRILVEHIFSAYFVGLPKEQTDCLLSMQKYLGNVGGAESVNQWRSATLSILHRDASTKLQDETTSVIEAVVARVNTIMDSMGNLKPTENGDQSLRNLISSSIELARLIRVQKAEFGIMMPMIEGYQRTMFHPETMEDIGGEDEDTLDEREIQCVIFPGILKTGDENGERSHLLNVIARIRVLCAPD